MFCVICKKKQFYWDFTSVCLFNFSLKNDDKTFFNADFKKKYEIIGL